MNRICVVPVWLQEALVARGLPISKISEPEWLESILSGPDVKSYEAAQKAMGIVCLTNIVEPLFRERTYCRNADAVACTCPELVAGVGKNDPARDSIAFYRALVCGVSYDSATTTKEQAQMLDFDFEWDGTTFFVVVKRAGSSVLEPTVRAAILERCVSVLRSFMTIEQVAANELFSRWLRETQKASGNA